MRGKREQGVPPFSPLLLPYLSRSLSTSLAPFWANSMAASLPIPLPAPVMIATLPPKRDDTPADLRCPPTTANLFSCVFMFLASTGIDPRRHRRLKTKISSLFFSLLSSLLLFRPLFLSSNEPCSFLFSSLVRESKPRDFYTMPDLPGKFPFNYSWTIWITKVEEEEEEERLRERKSQPQRRVARRRFPQHCTALHLLVCLVCPT